MRMMESPTTVDSHGVEAVAAFGSFLDDLFSRAQSIKQTDSIDPPLSKSNFPDLEAQLSQHLGDLAVPPDGAQDNTKKTHRFAVIETVVRDTFKNLVATIPIESPEFVKVWNLFDMLLILSDMEQCDPALLLWLVEELLDSQTIPGCRRVFDYLESRRESITAKHFKQKHLVILRTCNELLRRLSRALDPAFCGRVFIFMFQSLALGDRSSVNLRGEYHTENVTIFDREPPEPSSDAMEVDLDPKPTADKASPPAEAAPKKKALKPDELYPTFWSLQEFFSQPKRLFEPAQFALFKTALEETMLTFQEIKLEQSSRARVKPDKQVEDNLGGLKRKHSGEGDELAGSFNPKYLTSRDLFKLEISDLAFRRNIMVQALITVEFLISLSAAAKEKLSSVKAPNKSVMYADVQLTEEDTKWVEKTKQRIIDYVKSNHDGHFFFRMVETVLTRDKNWVRWKYEGCPPIERPPLSGETFVEARLNVAKMAATKRVRPTPMGSLSLDFLNDEDEDSALEKLKDPERHNLPDLESFRKGILEDELEIDMPTSNASKAAAIEGKASKTWRALRIASKSRLAMFDKIESDDKIDAIFKDPAAPEEVEDHSMTVGGDDLPDNKRPVIVVDTIHSKSPLVKELVARHPTTFARVLSHVTRKPQEGELSGKDHHFVDAQTFNMMRDGDQFLAFTDDGDKSQGTSKRMVEIISESGRIPIVQMDRDGVQQTKDMGFSARFIFLRPPPQETSSAALREQGLDNDRIQEILRASTEQAEHAAATPDFYDAVIDSTLESLESLVYEAEAKTNGVDKAGNPEQDVAMEDVAVTAS